MRHKYSPVQNIQTYYCLFSNENQC